MARKLPGNWGMKQLIRKYKLEFETEENINYYSYPDYVRAQRKYIKFLLGSAQNPKTKDASNAQGATP